MPIDSDRIIAFAFKKVEKQLIDFAAKHILHLIGFDLLFDGKISSTHKNITLIMPYINIETCKKLSQNLKNDIDQYINTNINAILNSNEAETVKKGIEKEIVNQLKSSLIEELKNEVYKNVSDLTLFTVEEEILNKLSNDSTITSIKLSKI